jgi:hypothetical protein
VWSEWTPPHPQFFCSKEQRYFCRCNPSAAHETDQHSADKSVRTPYSPHPNLISFESAGGFGLRTACCRFDQPACWPGLDSRLPENLPSNSPQLFSPAAGCGRKILEEIGTFLRIVSPLPASRLAHESGSRLHAVQGLRQSSSRGRPTSRPNFLVTRDPAAPTTLFTLQSSTSDPRSSRATLAHTSPQR